MLKDVADTLDAVTSADKRQAQDRGMNELQGLANAACHQIENDINLFRNQRKWDTERWRTASDELAKKGFSGAQIEKLLDDTPKPPNEHDHWLTVINPLEQEREKLKAFVGDFPRFDQSLLVGTRFENWQPEPTEADIDPAAMMQLCRGREMQTADA